MSVQPQFTEEGTVLVPEWLKMLHARAFSVHHDQKEIRAATEIKPTIGDHYPAVLRQMKVSKSTVLFLGQYVGKGATKEQFIQTFEMSDMRVVFKRDVERIENPVITVIMRD